MQEDNFMEEDTTEETAGDSEAGEPEYSFEGFNVEFSEKIMLTTVAPDASA